MEDELRLFLPFPVTAQHGPVAQALSLFGCFDTINIVAPFRNTIPVYLFPRVAAAAFGSAIGTLVVRLSIALLMILVVPSLSSADPSPPTDEFLWYGVPLTSWDRAGADRWKAIYLPVLEKFSRLEDCPIEHPGPIVDIVDIQFDFDGFSTGAEVEVCLFYLFARMDNLESIRRWTALKGFSNWFQTAGPNSLAPDSIYATTAWPLKKMGQLFSDSEATLFSKFWRATYEIEVIFSESRGLLSVRLGGNARITF